MLPSFLSSFSLEWTFQYVPFLQHDMIRIARLYCVLLAGELHHFFGCGHVAVPYFRQLLVVVTWDFHVAPTISFPRPSAEIAFSSVSVSPLLAPGHLRRFIIDIHPVRSATESRTVIYTDWNTRCAFIHVYYHNERQSITLGVSPLNLCGFSAYGIIRW